MVEQLDDVFHALADPTRRAMVRQLSSGERTVTELAAPHAMSLAAASKHVKVLERAGLLIRQVDGRRHVCRLEPAPLAAATEHLRFYERFWAGRLDALEAFVARNPGGATMTVPHSITVTRVLNATPADLYAAWTEPELMRQWYATVVDADVRVGGAYRIENHEADGVVYGFTGRYLELDPGVRLAFTFTSDLEKPEEGISDETVTVTFRQIEPGRTEVTVTNSWRGPEVGPEDLEALRGGWEEWMDRLQKLY